MDISPINVSAIVSQAKYASRCRSESLNNFHSSQSTFSSDGPHLQQLDSVVSAALHVEDVLFAEDCHVKELTLSYLNNRTRRSALGNNICMRWLLRFIDRMRITEVETQEVEVVVHVDTARRDVRVSANEAKSVLSTEHHTDCMSHSSAWRRRSQSSP